MLCLLRQWGRMIGQGGERCHEEIDRASRMRTVFKRHFAFCQRSTDAHLSNWGAIRGSEQSAAKLVDISAIRSANWGMTKQRTSGSSFRFARGDANRFPDLARELAGLNVDVFLASTEPAIHAAKDFGNGIPIVALSCDPLEKLFGSLARPGGMRLASVASRPI